MSGVARTTALGLALLLAACGRAPEPDAAAATQIPASPSSAAGLAGRGPEVDVTIGMHRVRAEVADTLALRRRGLSGRRDLPPGRGMLFPYAPPTRPSFWMPDMHFPIDIVWIRDGRIVDLHVDVPHEVRPPLPTYQPSVPIDWVLEVPAGTARELGWRIGDPVESSPTPEFRADARP
ncbi:MAG: hypothetical protein CL910_21050 [Deltaproteobacteria bacterium]|jgi:hypothetical protein|nr:hypothetical protein [Deltaproteobacteria bacterium]